MNQIQSLIRLGTISNIYNDQGIIRAQVIVLDEDSPEDVILLSPFGQNACPPVGSMVQILEMFGHSENKYATPFNQDYAPILQIGESAIYNIFGNLIYLKNNKQIYITADKVNFSKDVDIVGNETITGNINATDFINTAAVYKVDGTQVVTNQQPTIPNPTGGIIIDAEARTAINSILTTLKTHGLISI